MTWRYQASGIFISTTSVPGVNEALDYLRVSDIAGRFTDKLLRSLGLCDKFGIVVSGDTLPVKKPEPEPLLHAAAHFPSMPMRP